MRKAKTLTFLIILLALLVGCTAPQENLTDDSQEEKVANSEIEYSLYSDNGFSVLYPEWPETTEGDVELAVTKGYCSVAINSEMIPATQWYDMFEESITGQAGEIISSDRDSLQITYALDYQDINFVSENRIFVCDDKSTVVTLTCMEGVSDVMQKISDTIYPSAHCQDQEVEFNDFQEEDFSVDYPDWEIMEDGEEQRVLGITKGVCSVIVDKHNALPEDVFTWLSTAIEQQEDKTLVHSSIDDDEYNIIHQFPYEGSTITSTTRISYCNYQSYLTQVVCMDEYVTDNDDDIKNSVLESVTCDQEYDIPTAEKIEEEKEEIKEKEPEVIEEIEDEIVKTDAGEEFGIDEEMVVYFINSNDFFTNVMKDFPKASLLIEDEDRELKLRVLIDGEGKITLLEDGEYSDADVTLIIPLRDALNIFNNAENINPFTLISFAINVRTEPAEIKNQVIQKVLSGEYN
jgi:hypothetical protein